MSKTETVRNQGQFDCRGNGSDDDDYEDDDDDDGFRGVDEHPALHDRNFSGQYELLLSWGHLFCSIWDASYEVVEVLTILSIKNS